MAKGSKWAAVEGHVLRARLDRDERDRLLRSLVPFATSVAHRTCGRFVRIGHDDEGQVALLALNESIDCWDAAKGSFASFAATVIARRLIDYLRHEAIHYREVPFSALERTDTDGEVWNPATGGDVAMGAAAAAQADAEEAALVRVALAGLHLTAAGLEDSLPIHADAMRHVVALANDVEATPWLRPGSPVQLLPRRLAEAHGLSPQTVRRNRVGIVALAAIRAEVCD
jgi:RNA polymerase sigma factor